MTSLCDVWSLLYFHCSSPTPEHATKASFGCKAGVPRVAECRVPTPQSACAQEGVSVFQLVERGMLLQFCKGLIVLNIEAEVSEVQKISGLNIAILFPLCSEIR